MKMKKILKKQPNQQTRWEEVTLDLMTRLRLRNNFLKIGRKTEGFFVYNIYANSTVCEREYLHDYNLYCLKVVLVVKAKTLFNAHQLTYKEQNLGKEGITKEYAYLSF